MPAHELEIYKMDYKEYRDKLKQQKENMEKVFALVLGQCSQVICDCVEGSTDWPSINEQ